MFENASHMFGDGAAADGTGDGELVRRLLLSVPTARSRSAACCSAPDLWTPAAPYGATQPGTLSAEASGPPSSMPLQNRFPAWNRQGVESRPYSGHAAGAGLDRATCLQIDEFEDLIEKIDRLNGTPADESLAVRPSRPAPPKCTPFGPHRPPRISRTSLSSVDDDLEILLLQNPSLLDPPIHRDSGYDCDSGIDISPASRPFAPLRNALPPAGHDDRMAIDCSNLTEMTSSAAALGIDKMPGTPAEQDRPQSFCSAGPDSRSYYGSATPAPVRHCCIGPPTSLKSATMTTRTNLKQILQMQQVQDEERKEQEKAKMIVGTAVAQGGPNSTMAVTVPQTANLPPRVDVPSEVLKVESRLENPTRYHVMENKKRQLQEYLSTAQGTGRSLLVQSVPNDVIGVNAAANGSAASANAALSLQQHFSSSAPSPDSPNSVALSSSATSEADVIDTIIQMESSMDTDNPNFLHTSTMPGNTSFLEVLKYAAPSPTSAKSAPALTVKQEYAALNADPQLQALAKDRQKKDNHNMIERRRRYKINDHIKELATLLPKSSDPRFYEAIRADRQNKGNILKASVDYIREMKKELEHLRIEANDKKKVEQENWKLRLQNQQLINVHTQSSNGGSGSSPDVSYLLSASAEAPPVQVKREPLDALVQRQRHHHIHLSEAALDEFMDDDRHPVNGDPMLPSPVGNENILLSDEMDFIS